MNNSIRHRIVGVLLIGLMTLALITLGFGPGSAAPQGMQSMPGIEVILLHDNRYIPHHVPPPEQAELGVQAATFTVNWNPASCSGTVSPWSTEAQAAFQYAVNIWASLLNSSQAIEVDACWRSDLAPLVLGSASATTVHRDFTNAPVANTWYPVATASALANSDLNGGTAEIIANFNRNFNWYCGTDGNTPPTQVDFASVVLHELGHGLGFFGSMVVTSGNGYWGISSYPTIYDRFTEDNSGTPLLNYASGSAALAAALQSDNVFFDAISANAANGGSRVELYAPSTWEQGSSYSHLGEIFNGTPNALMTKSLGNGESEHSPGPVMLGMFQDMGWSVGNVGPVVYDSRLIDDDNSGQSSGNDDGIIDPGETIELYVTLRNQGSVTATSVNAAISTSDPYVTFTHNTNSSYPDIPGGSTGTNGDDFDFEVDSSASDGHIISFDLDITSSNGGPWSGSFCLTAGGGASIYLPIVLKGSSSAICSDTQLIQNGGFESGNTIWVEQSGPFIISQNYPRTGSWSAWFGGYDDADDRLYQSISIPANVSSARLILYLHVYSEDSLSTPYDYWHAELQDSSGGTLQDFLWADNTMADSGWWKGTVPWNSFASHAGTTRRLFFQGTNDSVDLTNFFVDDVTLWTYCGPLPAAADEFKGPSDGWTWEKVDSPPTSELFQAAVEKRR